VQTAELQDRLNRLGFDAGPTDGVEGPMTRTAVARFQLACALPGHNLVVDGVPGPRTWAALVAAGDGRLSPHFHVSELRTRTRLKGPKDGTAWVHRDLLHGLEALRRHVGRPLPVISGWRDSAHNRRVGGAPRSQHTFGSAPELDRLAGIPGRISPRAERIAGRAADIPWGYITLADARQLGLFSGLGHRDGFVTHVDVRLGVPATRPDTWPYR
jgi:hypothetical protein